MKIYRKFRGIKEAINLQISERFLKICKVWKNEIFIFCFPIHNEVVIT